MALHAITRFYFGYICLTSTTTATLSYLSTNPRNSRPGLAFIKGAFIGGTLGATVVGPFILTGYALYDINRKFTPIC